jgi:hypothetical protein
LIRVLGHAFGELPVRHLVQFVERVIPLDHGAGKIDIFAHESVHTVLEHFHRVRLDRRDQVCFRQRRVLI